MYKTLVIYLLHFLIYGLFSFSRRLLGQYLRCFKNESDKKGKQITELPSKVQHISLKHLASQNSARFICKKNEDLKRNVNKYYFAFFQDIWTIDVECCSKCNIFPPKKIQALFYNCFSVTSVWKLFDFPAKRLRKNTGAQNTHAPFFFFCIISSRKVSRLLCIIL